MSLLTWKKPSSSTIEEIGGVGWAHHGFVSDDSESTEPKHRFTLYYDHDRDNIYLKDYETNQEHKMDSPAIGVGQRFAKQILQRDEGKIVTESLNFFDLDDEINF